MKKIITAFAISAAIFSTGVFAEDAKKPVVKPEQQRIGVKGVAELKPPQAVDTNVSSGSPAGKCDKCGKWKLLEAEPVKTDTIATND